MQWIADHRLDRSLDHKSDRKLNHRLDHRLDYSRIAYHEPANSANSANSVSRKVHPKSLLRLETWRPKCIQVCSTKTLVQTKVATGRHSRPFLSSFPFKLFMCHRVCHTPFTVTLLQSGGTLSLPSSPTIGSPPASPATNIINKRSPLRLFISFSAWFMNHFAERGKTLGIHKIRRQPSLCEELYCKIKKFLF